MDKKRVWLVALVVLSLLVAASLACGPSAPTPPPAEPPEAAEPPEEVEPPEVVEVPEVVEPPEVAEPPEVVETPEEEAFSATTEALNRLDSFSGYVRWQGTAWAVGQEGMESDFEITGQRQNRPTRAEKWSWTDHKADTTTEWIIIEAENNMWTREGSGKWQAMGMYSPEIAAAFSAFSYDFWAGLFFEGLPAEATIVGQETVNGILCRHYRSTETSGWGFTVVGTTDLNVWIAVEGEYPVKSTADVSGTYQDKPFEWHFITEISNVNQPVDISPPI